MAREYAAVRHAMFAVPEWRKLSVRAQHLYLLLLAHPELSYAGVVDWRPNRLRQFAKGWSQPDFFIAAVELADSGWVVIDDETEEAMIRTFLRDDRVLEQSHLAVAMIKAYNAIASEEIRAAIIHELVQLHYQRPSLACWDDVRMLAILAHPAADGRDFGRAYDPPPGLILEPIASL